jgi:hypothetical protein
MGVEYRIVYTINGQGFTNDEPWVDEFVYDETEAIDLLGSLHDYNRANYAEHEEWIEVRDVTDWQRTDHVPGA